MSAPMIVLIGLAVLVALVPTGILLWARSAPMLSGRNIASYDGPHAGEDGSESVEPLSAVSDSGGGLSEDEAREWEALTSTSWNMPFHQ